MEILLRLVDRTEWLRYTGPSAQPGLAQSDPPAFHVLPELLYPSFLITGFTECFSRK